MTTEKIYGPWIKWYGGECPVSPNTIVEVKLRECPAGDYDWRLYGNNGDIMEYRTITEQPDLEAAEKLLRDNGYTVTPPPKPLTFEDVVPLTEAPPEGERYWVISAWEFGGVYSVPFGNDALDRLIIQRRMAYLDKEHALIAARHIFGLKGGEL